MKPSSKRSVAGYTLIEALVVIIMIGVLAAIAAPGWLAFVNRQRINSAQDKAFTVLRDAQVNAKRESRVWQACFQDKGTEVLWALQPVPAGSTVDCPQAQNWQSVIAGNDSKVISISDPKTTLAKNTAGGVNYYGISYTANGWVQEPAGGFPATGQKITFELRNNTSSPARCVYVRTLLGAAVTGKDAECN